MFYYLDTNVTHDNGHFFTPFKGLSVKLMMMDQVNNYIFEPLAEVFDEVCMI